MAVLADFLLVGYLRITNQTKFRTNQDLVLVQSELVEAQPGFVVVPDCLENWIKCRTTHLHLRIVRSGVGLLDYHPHFLPSNPLEGFLLSQHPDLLKGLVDLHLGGV